MVVAAVLGTDEPAEVSAVLHAAVGACVGVPVVGGIFYDPGVGIVAGLELADGRAVVAKVHRASFISRARLAAMVDVQAQLADGNVPAPRPLAGPEPLGAGWLTVEEFRGGGRADGYDPAVRAGMARGLYEFVSAGRLIEASADLGTWPVDPGADGLWPEPHDLRFDFAATSAGAEWIDDAARSSRPVLDEDGGTPVLGHLDWRVQNLAFDGPAVVAVYDWDSVACLSEAALVGVTSVVHPVDWRRDLPDPLPTCDQLDGFVADYEALRGAPFTDPERRVLTAAQTWVAGYGARCQHSDSVLGVFPDVDPARGWPRLLEELLRR